MGTTGHWTLDTGALGDRDTFFFFFFALPCLTAVGCGCYLLCFLLSFYCHRCHHHHHQHHYRRCRLERIALLQYPHIQRQQVGEGGWLVGLFFCAGFLVGTTKPRKEQVPTPCVLALCGRQEIPGNVFLLFSAEGCGGGGFYGACRLKTVSLYSRNRGQTATACIPSHSTSNLNSTTFANLSSNSANRTRRQPEIYIYPFHTQPTERN